MCAPGLTMTRTARRCCSWLARKASYASTTPQRRRTTRRVRYTASLASPAPAADAQRAQTLTGHGGAVNDLQMHPRACALLLSCSRDLSLRLWNIHSGVVALIVAGDGGHRNEVLSCGWHAGERCTFVSSAMDSVIKVWAPDDDMYLTVEAALQPWDASQPLGRFRTRMLQVPRFSTFRVHNSFIDCVRFMGDAILSKSVDNRVALWVPEARSLPLTCHHDMRSLSLPPRSVRTTERPGACGRRHRAHAGRVRAG